MVAAPVLVVATDGVWGVLSNQDVSRLASRRAGQEAKAVAHDLIQEAQRHGSSDNACAAVVYL